MSFVGLYSVRAFVPDDRNFILSTFVQGLYHGDSWFSKMPKSVFIENYKPVIETVVDNPNNAIQIACLKEDPSVIIGYSILSGDFQTIHWVYVKKNWRNKGVGRSLVPQHPSTVSHLNTLGESLLSKFTNVIFNPFKL